MTRTMIFGTAILLSSTALVSANEFEPALRNLAETQIRAALQDGALIEAIVAQNTRTAGLGNSEIIALDDQWRGEVGTAAAPTIDTVLTAPASSVLRRLRDESGGLYTEIFLMDAVGLNVAASDVTSDYWQGDEAKWQETYAVGPNSVHISDVEFDESTQMYQAQVSVSVADTTGAPVGAATFGVNIEYLF